MSIRLSELLTHLFSVVVVAINGWLIRTRGPQELVHGVVDWNRVDDATRRRAERHIGNVLFAVATWMTGFAVFRHQCLHDQSTNNLARVIFVGGLNALVLQMLFMLPRRRETRRTHGR